MSAALGLGLASLGLSAGSSLWNAISGWKAERARRRALAKRERENQLWYDRRYNEAGHERADAQRLLTKMRDAQKARMDRAAGAHAVVGADSGLKASEQQAANKAIGDTVANIDAAQEARKDKIENQYMARKDAIANANDKLDLEHQQQTANALTEASKLGAGVLSLAADYGNNAPTNANGTTSGNNIAGPVADPSREIGGSVWDDPDDWDYMKMKRNYHG